jgi:hypothetical protein
MLKVGENLTRRPKECGPEANESLLQNVFYLGCR